MTTLTMMERTPTGWKCPRCGDTQEDYLLPMQWAACNCAGLDTLRYGLSVTLTAEQLRERYPRHGGAEGTGDGVELEPFEAWAGVTRPRKP